jgi:hypothetical protein
MDPEATKKLQFLVSTLFEQVQRSVLRNRAYERLAPHSAEEVEVLLASPEFDELKHYSSEIHHQVIEAATSEDWPAIFGGLAELIGILNPQ